VTSWVHTLPQRTALLKSTAVNSILADVRRAQSEGTSVVSLMRGEPDFRTPQHIAEATVQALAKGRTAYPDNRGEPVLRDAVAHKLARDNGLTYAAGSEILITTGGTFGIYAALMALLEDGDDALLPDPIYDAYQSPILLAGGRIRRVPASIENGRFRLSIDALEAAVTSASRVLLLNSPWNPVGTVLTESELRAIGEFVVRRNLLLISDEVYEAIVYDGHRHISPAVLSEEVRARTVLINSFSKTYAMTGWRVGYCAGPAPIIQTMFLVLQQSSRGPATFIQDAAAVALTSSQQCVEDMRSEYSARRSRTLAFLPAYLGSAPFRRRAVSSPWSMCAISV
jgi:aspartate aminotransferase